MFFSSFSASFMKYTILYHNHSANASYFYHKNKAAIYRYMTAFGVTFKVPCHGIGSGSSAIKPGIQLFLCRFRGLPDLRRRHLNGRTEVFGKLHTRLIEHFSEGRNGLEQSAYEIGCGAFAVLV